MPFIWLSPDDLPPPPPEPDPSEGIPIDQVTEEQWNNVTPADLPQGAIDELMPDVDAN